MNKTSLLFKDKELFQRLKATLPYEGYKLERTKGKEFLYKNGYYTIILREGTGENYDLNEGYNRIEYLDYGVNSSKYIQIPKVSESKPQNSTNDALSSFFKDTSERNDEVVEEDNTYGIGVSNKSYYGTGIYNNRFRLGEREVVKEEMAEQDCLEYGIVVVQIKVNRAGKVVDALAGVKGTTNKVPCLLQVSKKAALSTLFNSDENSPAFQVGTILYNFKLSTN